MDFIPFPKIPRLSRNIVVTEKIDGTNACVAIADNGLDIYYQSRNRNVTPTTDNAGFAKWCEANKEELLKLGPGYHYGEWWGQGIQRGYGLIEKRFSLFNAGRWQDAYLAMLAGHENAFPKCCHVVPILSQHTFDPGHIDEVMTTLKETGSAAAPGYMNPEGIIIYHTQSKQMYKKTFEFDEKGKDYGA